MKPESSQKPVIVVLGMHRSGTSLIARSLQVLDVDLGDHLIPAISGDNDKGFWEDVDINDFDNALLKKIGSAWDRLSLLDEDLQSEKFTDDRKIATSLLKNKIKGNGLFGFKDPRTAILLPFWQTVFRNLDLDDRYVIAVRNPLNVANSLLERNKLPLEAGVMLWVKHMSGLLRHTRGKPRIVVDYDLMLESPSLQIQRISKAMSIPYDESCQHRLSLFENEFINKDLRHHKATLKELKNSELIPDLVKDAYLWMRRLAKNEIGFGNAELERFWKRFEERSLSYNIGYQYMDRLAISLKQYEGENKMLSEKLSEEEQRHEVAEKERCGILEEVERIKQQWVQTINDLDVSKKQNEHVMGELTASRTLQQEYQQLYQQTNDELLESSVQLSKFQTLHEQMQDELAESRKLQAEYLESHKQTKEELGVSIELQLKFQTLHQKTEAELDEVRQSLREYQALHQQMKEDLNAYQKSYKQTQEELGASRKLQLEFQSLQQKTEAELDESRQSLREYQTLHQQMKEKLDEYQKSHEKEKKGLVASRKLQRKFQDLHQQTKGKLDESRRMQREYLKLYQQVKDELDESRGLQQELDTSHQQIKEELDESRILHGKYQSLYQHALSERDNRQESYNSLHNDFNRAIAERDEAHNANQKYINENAALNAQITEILNSYSWRLTSVFRLTRLYLITLPGKALIKYLVKMLRVIWKTLPASPHAKNRLKKQLFKNIPSLFRHAHSYQNWLVSEESCANIRSHSSVLSEEGGRDLSGEEKGLYVPLCEDRVLTELPVKLVAFYLPQFHAIPENNEWWGEGFTEWTNVKPAKPQFKGHYQPHIPGELGYYDLTDAAVQKRQVELAKQFGIGGFCFYFYWFAGKRLLETPILNYLNDPSLDLPFCLCWANENWSRRWDGLDNDVLIEQQHSPEDDIAFIEYVSRYLRDPRNMQIDGRPLLLVYRPSLLPSPIETAQRWRRWCRENGIGEIYLAYTQSFEVENPEKYGFDAAVEFPPNNSGPPVITEQVEQVSAEFTGIIYDWRIFVERSKNYQQPDYTLFRSVTPSWDNTARRKTDGAIFAHSSPEGYQGWLIRAIEDTLVHRENKDERMVFINAWNEWAEGAYLEPDEKYGYAYLQATRNAIEHIEDNKGKRSILLVIHDAYPHGAQYLILNMAKVLHESMGFIVDMFVLGDGPLIKEYRKYANIHELAGCDIHGKETAALVQRLRDKGVTSAITNTTVSGLIVPLLKQCGFTVVSLIHELPKLIKDYRLQEHAKAIAVGADKIVFAADAVRNGFELFEKLDETKVVIRPQGLYKKNSLQTEGQVQAAHQELRKRFNLASDAKIILGVGFADYRKGIDIFVNTGIEVLKNAQNIYFLWLGDFEDGIEREVKQTIEESGFDDYFIFPGLDCASDIYYAGADIYALTSREDPFPSVVLEALDALTPVVAFTESGGSAELLSKFGGVLVDEVNSKAFSAALTELINNPDRVSKLGKEGKEIIDEEFSFRKYLFDLTSLAQTGLKRVSVVVPNYNYERYIKARLSSIIDQSCPIYEIIILDDASSDNSVGVIKDFIKDQTIDCKFIVNASNSGNVFKQWAKGVELSSGEYVWIAEADDLSDPDFLNEVLKGFDYQDVVLSYCESKQMDSTGDTLCDNYLDYVSDISREKWLSNFKEKGINEITRSLAIKNTIPNASAVVFKREIISKVLKEKIDEIQQYKNAGDWITYIYTLNYGDITYSCKSLNYHRRHESSVTISSFDMGQLEEILAVQKKIKEMYVVDDSISARAGAYSQALYEQFGLVTNDAKNIFDNHKLIKYFDEGKDPKFLDMKS